MSGKTIITLAAAATVAVASLASSSSTYARSFGGGIARGNTGSHVGGAKIVRTTGSTLNPGKPGRTGILCALGKPCPPHHPGPPIWVWHHHHDHHWVFRGGRWIIDDVAVESPVTLPAAVTPAPCTCLTKTYTPTGLVVFADVCTKESASAPATDDTADASQAPTTAVPATATPISQVPTAPNYAGRTYQEYLAANPEAAQPQAAMQPAQPAQPTPSSPSQN
ncbi:MAG TPA: hypothetical protein VMF12_09215 [Xanthobacteraceae bacterium]|nr:hypothetical protein [Xanthobacteraceae bacterium]